MKPWGHGIIVGAWVIGTCCGATFLHAETESPPAVTPQSDQNSKTPPAVTPPSDQNSKLPPANVRPGNQSQTGLTDQDQDGISLHRDHCPQTPPGAAIDNRGCAVDSDRDGVLEKEDLCPNTPFGVTVDAKGCPRDSDADGVIDDLDRCPETPRGVVVDPVGCPLDTDGDGVPDSRDACPGTPPGVVVDAKGCWMIPNLNFATGSWVIPTSAHGVLREVAALLKHQPDLRVTIQGHTDTVGGDAFNQELSLRRAKAVQEFFVHEGVDDQRLAVVGHGLTQPVADNETPAGRAKNRRVVLDVLQ